MMITQIVGMQQIVITVVFLLFLIGLLVFLRMKSGLIKANLQKGQRIKVIEEIAVSPVERLRLITIDSHEFVMLCGKGSSLTCPIITSSQQIQRLPEMILLRMNNALVKLQLQNLYLRQARLS